MTVIAWDGSTLAADKRAVNGTLPRTTTKIFRTEGRLVGTSGDQSVALQMLDWYRNGREAKDFPKRAEDDSASLLVIEPNRSVWMYTTGPVAAEFHDRQFAIGSGRDFAIAAMHLGKSAREAVEIACMFDNYCGNGIDALELES